MSRRWWIFVLATLSAGCTLISLDPLQSELVGGAGGTDGGGGATASTSNTGGQGGSPAQGGAGGSGGTAPIYDACVLADGPSLYLRMTPSASPETNLGSLGGSATVTGFSAAGPSLVTGGDGARTLLSGTGDAGSLAFDAPVFTGGQTSTTIELWFRAPDWAAATYPLVVGASPAALTLRLERRFDVSGLDAIYFVGHNGPDVREVRHFVDLLEPPAQDHHLVVVYRQSATTVFDGGGDSDDLLVYLDGQLVEPAGHGDPVSVAPVAPPLTLGEGYQGLLDELAVYPVELSAARIQAHFDAGRDGVPCP